MLVDVVEDVAQTRTLLAETSLINGVVGALGEVGKDAVHRTDRAGSGRRTQTELNHRLRQSDSAGDNRFAAALPEVNARAAEDGGVAIDTLVAGIEEGRRSFHIYRATPDGKSYARDIANKYGLSLEEITGRLKAGKEG